MPGRRVIADPIVLARSDRGARRVRLRQPGETVVRRRAGGGVGGRIGRWVGGLALGPYWERQDEAGHQQAFRERFPGCPRTPLEYLQQPYLAQRVGQVARIPAGELQPRVGGAQRPPQQPGECRPHHQMTIATTHANGATTRPR